MGGVTIRCILICQFLLWYQAGHGQRQLVLVKHNKIVARYVEGERIRFQRKDRAFVSEGIITGIYTKYFKLGEQDTTWLYQIKSVDLRGHPNMAFKTAESGQKLMLAGAILIGIDALNSDTGVDTGVAVVSSALFGTGLLLQFVNNNLFRTGYKRRVIVMEYKP